MKHVVRVLCSLLCVAAAGAAGANDSARVGDLPADPGAVVLDFRTWSDGMAEADRIVQVRVLADGQIEVHRPFWMKQPGDWRGRLTRTELTALLDHLLERGFDRVDGERAMEAAEQADAAQRSAGQDYEASERAFTVIAFDLPQVIRAGRVEAVKQRFSYVNLQLEARRFPALSELAAAADAQHRLWKLLDHASLQRVAEVQP
jgi:hypothetical protein